MSNRVEDLERQVAELQAAVNGLTEELVEMKERVRQVEDAQAVSVETDQAAVNDGDAEPSDDVSDTASEDQSGGERRTHSDDHVEVVERTASSDESTDESASGGDADDIVVPEESATMPDADAAPSESEGDETDGDESDDNDIIVA